MNKREQIIEVIPYDRNRITQYKQEKELLSTIFGNGLLAQIHHIGSTAIPGMHAKPTIDILIAVNNIAPVDHLNSEMHNAGYEAWGEYRIPGRRFFVKGESKRSHHVHVFAKESEHILRHIVFRDYLIAHPQKASEYAKLKLKLATSFRHNRRAYVIGKQDHVKSLEQEALSWFQACKNTQP